MSSDGQIDEELMGEPSDGKSDKTGMIKERDRKVEESSRDEKEANTYEEVVQQSDASNFSDDEMDSRQSPVGGLFAGFLTAGSKMRATISKEALLAVRNQREAAEQKENKLLNGMEEDQERLENEANAERRRKEEESWEREEVIIRTPTVGDRPSPKPAQQLLTEEKMDEEYVQNGDNNYACNAEDDDFDDEPPGMSQTGFATARKRKLYVADDKMVAFREKIRRIEEQDDTKKGDSWSPPPKANTFNVPSASFTPSSSLQSTSPNVYSAGYADPRPREFVPYAGVAPLSNYKSPHLAARPQFKPPKFKVPLASQAKQQREATQSYLSQIASERASQLPAIQGVSPLFTPIRILASRSGSKVDILGAIKEILLRADGSRRVWLVDVSQSVIAVELLPAQGPAQLTPLQIFYIKNALVDCNKGNVKLELSEAEFQTDIECLQRKRLQELCLVRTIL